MFDAVVVKQIESGEISDLDSRWLINQCLTKQDEAAVSNDRITVPQVRGIFYILVFAIGLSIIGLFYQVRPWAVAGLETYVWTDGWMWVCR